MHILVTGSSGFIGTNLTIALKKLGHKVTGLDIKHSPLHDISNYQTLKSLTTKPSTIVHLAALTGVLQSVQYPVQTFKSNILGTFSLLEYARKNSIKNFIFISSCSILSPTTTPYSASKLIGERLCATYSDTYSINIDILRLTNIFGPFSAHKTSVIPKFIKQILSNQPMTVRGDGSQSRSFVYVSDVVDSITHYISNPSRYKIHTIAGEQKTILNLVDELILAFPRVPEVKFVSEENEPKSIEVISSIKPKVDFRSGINKTLRWFMDYQYERKTSLTSDPDVDWYVNPRTASFAGRQNS